MSLVFLGICGVCAVFVGGVCAVRCFEVKYGSARELDSVSASLKNLQDRVSKIDPEGLRKLHDEVSSLKAKGVWR